MELAADLETSTLVLLVIGLLIAFGFEFINGFHDTANAVATVIYTRSLRPAHAVVWSGLWNAAGVVHATTTGLVVAFSIVHLLPVDLLVSAGGAAGLAMVFSLLLAAVIWNLGTWLLGLPASSSHTLIGSVLGVGLAASVGSPAGLGAGVNWGKASQVLLSLVVSPLLGFACGALFLWLARRLVRRADLHAPAPTDKTPPAGVRALLVLSCTGVSFAHGSNDGQKGIGLIMLILMGILPATYALNTGVGPEMVHEAVAAIDRMDAAVSEAEALGHTETVDQVTHGGAHVDWRHVRLVPDARPTDSDALRQLLRGVRTALTIQGGLAVIPPADRWSVRASILRARQAVLDYDAHHVDLPTHIQATLRADLEPLTRLTEYAPTWVPLGVALALGIGTMIGWKRIVVTVGEKIGKTPMSYAQGSTAQIVTAGTILLADVSGAPVSTTHILSSSVAGSMTAAGSGLDASTMKHIALAWVLTLPASMLLSAVLYMIAQTFLS